MKVFLSFFFIIAIGCNSQPSKNTIDKVATSLINSFFKGILDKEPTTALEQLLMSNPNINLEDSGTLSLKSSFIYINEISGVFMGHSLLKKRLIEDHIGIYSYLGRYEKKFYRFIFIFYNNGTTVKLYKFLFDDDLDDELEASLKYYLN